MRVSRIGLELANPIGLPSWSHLRADMRPQPMSWGGLPFVHPVKEDGGMSALEGLVGDHQTLVLLRHLSVDVEGGFISYPCYASFYIGLG